MKFGMLGVFTVTGAMGAAQLTELAQRVEAIG